MAIEFKKREQENANNGGKICAYISTKDKKLDEKITKIMEMGESIENFKDASKAYKKMKKYDSAIIALKKAKEICQFDPEIYYELGINHLLNEQNNEARKNFIRTIRLDKSNINAQLQLAISHELMDEEFMAIAIYKKIIDENPCYILAYNHLASLYIELEMFAEAQKLFTQILNIQPDYYRANLGLGICFDKMKKFGSAIRFYKKYIVKKPKSKIAHALANRIADIYAKKGFSKGNLNVIEA